MKKLIRCLLIVLLLSGVLMIGQTKDVSAKSIYLNKTDITLNPKQTYTLSLKNTSAKKTWSSNNGNCTVSSKGKVTAKKAGTSVITVTASGKSYKCTVVVQTGKISPTSASMRVGSTLTIRKSIKYSAKWSSSNKSIAKVTSSGKVTALKAGSCTITCTIKKKKYKCKITVTSSIDSVTLNPSSTPYNNKYMKMEEYTSDPETHMMYTFRSYMKKFETDGGGVLTLSKGQYPLKGGCFVPANVTIKFSDGATVYKSGTVGSKHYKVSLFSLVPPSVVDKTTEEAAAFKDKAYKAYRNSHPKASAAECEAAAQDELNHSGYCFKSAVKAYNGSHDVKFLGAQGGTSVIDHKGKYYTFGIESGHAKNITVQDIQFKNMDGNHFIELNSSKNVLVQRCTFTDDLTTYNWNVDTGKGYYNTVIAEGSTKAKIANKEAINIDACDPNYQGFNNPWAYHDYTACDGVTIQNCKFTRLVRPIGSHKYTCKYNSSTKKWDKQVYNTNIKIYKNTIKDSGANAICMCNWNHVTIDNNTIDTVDNMLKNPYYDPNSKANCNEYFFYSINPGKTEEGKTVVATRSALKANCAIVIFGGGSDFKITNNTITNAKAGVVALNLQNMNGAADNEISKYSLSKDSKDMIKNKNKFNNMWSKCNYFFSNDSTIAKYGSKVRSFSGKREYLPSEFNIDWDKVLKDYYDKYCNSAVASEEETTAVESVELEDKEASTTTAVTTEAATSETATETTTTEQTVDTEADEAVK